MIDNSNWDEVDNKVKPNRIIQIYAKESRQNFIQWDRSNYTSTK